jgi:hypothetical protein
MPPPHLLTTVSTGFTLLFSFWGSTGVWTQSLPLEPLHQPFFCNGLFWNMVSQTICPGWLWTSILLISAWSGWNYRQKSLARGYTRGFTVTLPNTDMLLYPKLFIPEIVLPPMPFPFLWWHQQVSGFQFRRVQKVHKPCSLPALFISPLPFPIFHCLVSAHCSVGIFALVFACKYIVLKWV